MRKFYKSLLLITIFIFSIITFSNYSFAVLDSNGITLGLYNYGNTRKTGYYTVGNEQKNDSHPVIKIVEYNKQGTVETTKPNRAIYCLKDGVGFGATDVGASTAKTVEYTNRFDMRKPSEIGEKFKSALPSTDSEYNKLMWVLDTICLPEDSDSVDELLGKAELDRSDFETNTKKMTDDEFKDIIEVIQQSAIWYITNKGDKYQPSGLGTFYFSSTPSVQGTNIDDKYDFGIESPIVTLYQYFINQLESKSDYDYTSSELNEDNVITLDKNNATSTLENGYYYVGPYKVTKADNILNFNVKILVDNKENDNVTLVKADKSEISGSTITDKVNSVLDEQFYIKLPVGTSANNVNIKISGKKEVKTLTYWSTPESSVETNQPVVIIEKTDKEFSVEDTKQIAKPKFDLSLRKFITQVAGNPVSPSREPEITQESLRALATNGTSILDNGTTSTKTHTKDPISVKTGNKVVYTIRVYNEGEIDGYAEEIMDYLPDGLSLVPADQSTINAQYGWQADADNAKIIRTKYLSRKYKDGKYNEGATDEEDNKDNIIKAFNKTAGADGKYTIDYKDLQVECIVNAEVQSTDKHLKNVAEITSAYNAENAQDRDSQPNNLTDNQKDSYNPGTSTQGKGYEDDDDYEDLVLPGKYFDLALRKFITEVNGVELSKNGKYDREPVVDVSPLLNGEKTAKYKHTKVPISVSVGDIVTYTLRIYNEGQVDGYADEIVDHLPPELEFLPDDELNQRYLWLLDSADATQRTIRTTYLSKDHDTDNIIVSFNRDSGELSYKDIQVRCRVVKTAQTQKTITNIADITKSSNEENLVDRDNEKNVILPQDEDLPNYKGKDTNKDDLSDSDYYYEGQEDDDDFEKLILEKFDLALRKFITGVNDEEITNRIPRVDTSKYGTIEDGKEITSMTYEHTKEPVRVSQNDIVIYTIRVYNEGTKSGYAAEIKDDIPDGLEFVEDNEINNEYGWVLYDEEGNVTTDVKKAVTIRTDYLSKEKEQTEGENLLKGFDKETMDVPDYRDVKVAFKVTEPNTSDRIITNSAQISKDTDENGDEVDDDDSTPDEWKGEDDEDTEKVYVKYFDLSLRKWVSQVILIEDGVQKEMDTGHYAEQDPEPVVKVELNKKRIENTIIKFRYQIRIKNEGEIEGYATEISDYIPEGLKFNQADNPKWKEENGKIVTDQLKDTLLQPGETATIEVTLTWINDENNLSQKVNVAEISEDDNPSDTPDIDSTPNNKKDGEDDIDDAPVVLTVVTGSAPIYISLIAGTILIVGIGALIIKRFVI